MTNITIFWDNLNKVLFECDSKLLVYMVKNIILNSNTSTLQPLLKEVHSLIHISEGSTSLCHIFREANRCANFLSKEGLNASLHYSVLDDISPLST